MKRLQFGTSKCFKLHVGKTCNEAICKDLHVDGWRIDLIENVDSGKIEQEECFNGLEKMMQKADQVYLGDIISADGKHLRNVKARKG